jgi:hypothetical protein
MLQFPIYIFIFNYVKKLGGAAAAAAAILCFWSYI